MCRHCSVDPSFRGFDLRFHRSGLRWFSPLGATFRFGDFRSAGCPSGSRLPLFGTHRFGVAARRVGLRAHGFRFSARTASGLPSSDWRFRLPLRRLPLGGLAFGLTASPFRHAPLRGCPRRVGASAFRFGVCHSAGWCFRLPLRGCRSAGWPSGSPLRRFGTHRFGLTARWVGSAASRFGDCRWAGWPSGSRLLLFGMRRSAPPCRRREGRRSTPTRHLFHFKTLIPTC